MKYCSGQTKYLIAIKEILDLKGYVRSVDIANRLGVSKPSVSKMINCMGKYGLLIHDKSIGIELTSDGEKAVDEIFYYFDEIFIFFNKFLKLPPDDAHSQAVKFITEFPNETCDGLKRIVKKTIKKRN